jgi:hypothetical protein
MRQAGAGISRRNLRRSTDPLFSTPASTWIGDRHDHVPGRHAHRPAQAVAGRRQRAHPGCYEIGAYLPSVVPDEPPSELVILVAEHDRVHFVSDLSRCMDAVRCRAQGVQPARRREGRMSDQLTLAQAFEVAGDKAEKDAILDHWRERTDGVELSRALKRLSTP